MSFAAFDTTTWYHMRYHAADSVRPLYFVLPSRTELLSDLLPAVGFVPFGGKIGVE